MDTLPAAVHIAPAAAGMAQVAMGTAPDPVTAVSAAV
jgi:hypothetical protein